MDFIQRIYKNGCTTITCPVWTTLTTRPSKTFLKKLTHSGLLSTQGLPHGLYTTGVILKRSVSIGLFKPS